MYKHFLPAIAQEQQTTKITKSKTIKQEHADLLKRTLGKARVRFVVHLTTGSADDNKKTFVILAKDLGFCRCTRDKYNRRAFKKMML